MTLSNSYHEIMEHIEMTDEMRQRVLQNLPKQRERQRIRKILPAAACIMLVLLCGSILRISFPTDSDSSNELASPVADVKECASAEELSELAGFPVTDVESLPFPPVISSYTWCWNEFTQITYEGENDSVTYRKAAGKDDISGDYNEYEQVNTIYADNISVTFKGSEEVYYLAIWQIDDYSYALSDEQGISLEQLEEMVRSVLPEDR